MATQVAVLVEQDYQDLEVWYPILRFREAGLKVVSVGTGSQASYKGKAGYPITPDTTIDKVKAADLSAVIVPGGWAPDFLRRFPAMVQLVRDCDAQKKVIGAICHGGWLLCSAGILKGRTVTSFSAIKDDCVNAGAHWVDQEVVVDGNLVTSRKPDDLPAFCKEILAKISQTVRSSLDNLT